MKYTFDACALIALINEENGADLIEDLLQQAQAKKAVIYMSVANLIEVYYGYIRERGIEQASKLLDIILAYPIEIIYTITDSVFREAARMKACYKIPLGDSIAVATASCLDSTIVTSDYHDLKPVEQNEKIPFLWIR
jgi:predicted nucleic acid-binding protein